MNKKCKNGLTLAGLVVSLAIGTVWPSYGATISGKITVMKKGGRNALDSFEHTLVYLSGIEQTLTSPPNSSPIIVNQKEKQFFPRLLPLIKGQVVHFYNQDELDHNVFSTEEANSFDLGRYPKGDFRPISYDQTGNYKVYCNIHQNMILDIVVLENRYFATTDEAGEFAMNDVPAGDYQLNVWHIFGANETQKITVTEAPLVLAPMTIVSTKVIRELESHTDKHGKSYNKKKGRYRR